MGLCQYGENHKDHVKSDDNDAINSSQFKVLHQHRYKLKAESEEEKGCRHQLNT